MPPLIIIDTDRYRVPYSFNGVSMRAGTASP